MIPAAGSSYRSLVPRSMGTPIIPTVNLSFTLRVHASSTTSAHHLGKHEAKLATLEIMFRAIRTRKIWPLASPRVVPKSVPNP